LCGFATTKIHAGGRKFAGEKMIKEGTGEQTEGLSTQTSREAGGTRKKDVDINKRNWGVVIPLDRG